MKQKKLDAALDA